MTGGTENRVERRTMTEVLRELEAVKQQLRDTPAEARTTRQDLRDREAALRFELRRMGRANVPPASIAQLKRRIAVVERKIQDHFGTRMSSSSGAAGHAGGGGLDPQALHRFNRATDRAADLEGMRAELQRLRDELADLEQQSS